MSNNVQSQIDSEPIASNWSENIDSLVENPRFQNLVRQLMVRSVETSPSTEPKKDRKRLERPRFPFDKARPDAKVLVRHYRVEDESGSDEEEAGYSDVSKIVERVGDNMLDTLGSASVKGTWDYPDYLVSALFCPPGEPEPSSRAFQLDQGTVAKIKRKYPLPNDPYVAACKVDTPIASLVQGKSYSTNGLQLVKQLGQYQEGISECAARLAAPCLDVAFQLLYHFDEKRARKDFPEFFLFGDESIPRFEQLSEKELKDSLFELVEGLRILHREMRRIGLPLQKHQREVVVNMLPKSTGSKSWRDSTEKLLVTEEPGKLFGEQLVKDLDVEQERSVKLKFLQQRSASPKLPKQPGVAKEGTEPKHQPARPQQKQGFGPRQTATTDFKNGKPKQMDPKN